MPRSKEEPWEVATMMSRFGSHGYWFVDTVIRLCDTPLYPRWYDHGEYSKEPSAYVWDGTR